MAVPSLSKDEQEFLFKVFTYVEGDISRPLFYMDIDALAREIGASKDDVYAVSQKLEKLGFIESDVAGYLEVTRIVLTPAGDAYVRAIKQH